MVDDSSCSSQADNQTKFDSTPTECLIIEINDPYRS